MLTGGQVFKTYILLGCCFFFFTNKFVAYFSRIERQILEIKTFLKIVRQLQINKQTYASLTTDTGIKLTQSLA